jgi:hypothetical protein
LLRLYPFLEHFDYAVRFDFGVATAGSVAVIAAGCAIKNPVL